MRFIAYSDGFSLLLESEEKGDISYIADISPFDAIDVISTHFYEEAGGCCKSAWMSPRFSKQ